MSQKSEEPESEDKISFGNMVQVVRISPAGGVVILGVLERAQTASLHLKETTDSARIGKGTTEDEPICINSGVSRSFFRKREEVTSDSYKTGSQVEVQMAAGNKKVQCIAEGTLNYGSLKVPECAQVLG